MAAESHVVRTQRLEVHGDVSYGGGGVYADALGAVVTAESIHVAYLPGFVVDEGEDGGGLAAGRVGGRIGVDTLADGVVNGAAV